MSALSHRLEEKYGPLVGALYGLASDRNRTGPIASSAREQLANLRAGASFTPQGKLRSRPALFHCCHGSVPLDDAVTGRPPEGWTVSDVVAALFAMAPEERVAQAEHRRVTLAKAFGNLWRRENQTDSIEKRFLALVNTRPETLPSQLRHAVRLLDSHAEEFDWYTLPGDLAAWGRSERRVQDRWLREFYVAPAPADDAPEAGFDGDEIETPEAAGEGDEG